MYEALEGALRYLGPRRLVQRSLCETAIVPLGLCPLTSRIAWVGEAALETSLCMSASALHCWKASGLKCAQCCCRSCVSRRQACDSGGSAGLWFEALSRLLGRQQGRGLS